MQTNYCKNDEKLLDKALKNRITCILLIIYLPLSSYAQDYSFQNCLDYYKDGDAVKAIECLSEYIKKNPKDVDALNIRAKCYKYESDYLLAFSDINDAIKFHNKKASSSKDGLYAQRGKLYEDIENYDEAFKDYATAFKINPKNTNVLFERANLYYSLKNYSASDTDWKHVLKLEKDNINAQVGLTRNMIARGQIDDAIKELDRLEKIDPRNPYVYRCRSESYSQKKNYRKAIDDLIYCCYLDDIDRFKKDLLSDYAEYEFTYTLAKVSEIIVRESDDRINWRYLRIELYESYEMYQEAVEDYNTIETLLPSPNISIFYGRGKCYSKMGQYDKAIADFNEGIELQENEYLYLYRAEAKRLKGDYKSSITDFTKVIELDPMSSYAYYKRGWTKEFDKDYQGALKDYTTSIELNKDYAYIYITRGRLYQAELNQPQLAEKDFETALLLDKKIIRSGNCRQYALFHLGKIDDAIAHQNSILEKYPTSGNYYDATCLYSLMNRPTDAIKYLQIAFEKGYRGFIHMEHDKDLDNIRNNREYIELVEEWKQKIAESFSTTSQVLEAEPKQTKKYVVKTKELKSGTYEIPCTINDLPLRFIFDTGASDITLSSVEAAFMLKNNYLNEYDFRDRRNYRTASGDIVEGTKVRLRKIKIGELELNNIEASIVHKQNAPLLFGQSALGKFVKITIDNKNNEIIFEH
jgi:clan AA aspartic protease (TIGR02281 family)